MKLATLTTLTATCAVQWCATDDHDNSGIHATNAAPIEILDLFTGRPAVVCVEIAQDIDQQDADAQPRITVLGGSEDGFDMDLSLRPADAKRIALAMLAQIARLDEGAR